MRKFMIMATMLVALAAFAACGSNDNENMPGYTTTAIATTTTQNENNHTSVIATEAPTENIPPEELKIQIGIATDELLSTFTNLHHAHLNQSGVNLAVWANQPLPHLAVVALEPEWLDGSDEWGFIPRDSLGYVEMLLPGEGYVIMNYMGLGTLPHMGISFFDEEVRETRVFFFQENHAYPEHGDRWVIHEIEASRLVWGFPSGGTDVSNEGDYSIIINGVGFAVQPYDNAIGAAYTSASAVYTMAGQQYPTHVVMSVLWALGLDAIQGGSQVSVQHNGANIGVALSVTNYLNFGADRVAVGIDDTFMADNGYFTQYIPISLIRHLGFNVHFDSGRVHISGELDVAVNPHPLAVALQNFIDNSGGQTRAHSAHIAGNTGVLAIEFIDGFAWATLFVHTWQGVVYKEIGNIDGFPFSVGFTTEGWGSLVKTTGDGGRRSYTTFAVVTNPATMAEEIIYHFTIYAELQDDQSINYSRFNGGWLEGIEGGRYPITQEQFYEIFDGMGGRINCWCDFGWDSTESILAWVSPAWQ